MQHGVVFVLVGVLSQRIKHVFVLFLLYVNEHLGDGNNGEGIDIKCADIGRDNVCYYGISVKCIV